MKGSSMKKPLLVMVGAITLASISLAQTNVVLSRNAVGYVRVSVPRDNLILIANNFIPMTGTHYNATSLIGNQLPLGAQLFLWDPVEQQYRFENLGFLGWSPGTNPLTPGRGFWAKVPASAPSNSYTVYLMGEVPDRFTMPSNTVGVYPGYNLVSWSYPTEIKFTNTALAASGVPGDSAIFWNPNTTSYYYENRGFVGWVPGTNTLSPGMGFWYKRVGNLTNWVQPKPYTWP